ncbi:MAG: IclR family transcriptional regulator [Caldimonas sp.]
MPAVSTLEAPAAKKSAAARDRPPAQQREPETDRQFSNNLARGLDVLRAFTPADPVLGNRDLADRTGLPKPTISRLTYTLTLLGYLSYVERLQKYRLGAGVLSMGYPLLASLQIRQFARPVMERIARESGCTVNLGMRDRTQVVYVDTCRVDSGNLYQPDIGSSRPLLLTSIGRAILIACAPAERTAILNRIKVGEPANHAAGLAFWQADLKAFGERGYCLSRGDWKKEIHAVAAPIRMPQREETVALNCTMSAHRLAKDTLERKLAPLLLEGVRAIEASCGLF